jgi:hypothetical protein
MKETSEEGFSTHHRPCCSPRIIHRLDPRVGHLRLRVTEFVRSPPAPRPPATSPPPLHLFYYSCSSLSSQSAYSPSSSLLLFLLLTSPPSEPRRNDTIDEASQDRVLADSKPTTAPRIPAPRAYQDKGRRKGRYAYAAREERCRRAA